MQPGFHQVHFAVELAAFLAFAHFGAVAGRGKKSRNARAARPAALGQGALRNQLHFQLAAEQLALKLGVFAHVAGNHLLYLLGLQQQANAKVVDARVVRDAGEVFHAEAQQLLNGVFGNAAEAEAAEHQGHAIGDALEGFLGVRNGFVYHGWDGVEPGTDAGGR